MTCPIAQDNPNSEFHVCFSEFKALSANDDGSFEGYASIFGNVDLQRDVVEPGAFTKTIEDIKRTGTKLKAYWTHMLTGVKSEIGYWVDFIQDQHGLFVKGFCDLGTDIGKLVHDLIKLQLVKGLSIGYSVVKAAKDGGIRRLEEVTLHEISITPTPANPQATITNFKSLCHGECNYNDYYNSVLQGLLAPSQVNESGGSVAYERLLNSYREEVEAKALSIDSNTSGGYVAPVNSVNDPLSYGLPTYEREREVTSERERERPYETKPYPNFHACRLQDPADFTPNTFRTMDREHNGKAYQVIVGDLNSLNGQGGQAETITDQAYHYPVDVWNESDAKAHCGSHDGILFEPSSSVDTNDNKNNDGKQTKESETMTDEEYKTVISFATAHKGGTPKAPEDSPWDGPAETAKASVDDLKIMCAWVDPEHKDIKQGYKFPHHKAEGGHAVVWMGVRAAFGAINGARTPPAIPEGDKAGIEAHLQKHAKEFGKELGASNDSEKEKEKESQSKKKTKPEKSKKSKKGKRMREDEEVEGKAAFDMDHERMGQVKDAHHHVKCAHEDIKGAHKALHIILSKNPGAEEPDGDEGGDFDGDEDGDGNGDGEDGHAHKAGRVFSQDNMDAVRDAHDGIKSAHERIKSAHKCLSKALKAVPEHSLEGLDEPNEFDMPGMQEQHYDFDNLARYYHETTVLSHKANRAVSNQNWQDLSVVHKALHEMHKGMKGCKAILGRVVGDEGSGLDRDQEDNEMEEHHAGSAGDYKKPMPYGTELYQPTALKPEGKKSEAEEELKELYKALEDFLNGTE